MDKVAALDILMLLSALESWSFSAGKPMPDYLHDKLLEVVQKLADGVLGPPQT